MRPSLIIALVILGPCWARSDEPSSAEPILWQQPFEAISASRAADALVLVLITNEDPFLIKELADRTAKRDGVGKAESNPPIWCADVLSLSYRKTLDRRN